MSTRDTLKNRRRQVRPVELPGGDTVHVRSLSIAELERIDVLAGELPDGPERNVRRAVLMAGYALCEPDGSPSFPRSADVNELLAEASQLTPEDLEAVCSAVVPDVARAKN